jgi:DNA-binding MarR family transcriptional regulator
MASNKHEFKTAIFENGSCVVLRVDPSQPHFMEVVASFYDAERARDYARFENGQQGEHQEDAPIKEPASKPKAPASKAKPQPSEPISKAKPEASEAISNAKPQASEPIKDSTDLSERQQEVLNALRSLMDKKNLVEVPSAELAKASSIPLGSLHSVLASLEKKNMIRTERPGSAKFRAIYEVLGTRKKSARSINGAVHDSHAPFAEAATL